MVEGSLLELLDSDEQDEEGLEELADELLEDWLLALDWLDSLDWLETDDDSLDRLEDSLLALEAEESLEADD